jgi:hypothetical protein
MTPTPFEKTPAAVTNPDNSNRRLAPYCASIRAIAKQRSLFVVDLFGLFLAHQFYDNDKVRFTENGVHLTEEGYKLTTMALGAALTDGNRKGVDELLIAAIKNPSLRQAIIEKNQLYFYRWRPQNETYLFGFRKHEQGKNAKEVAEFDPLIAAKEKEIAKLRMPKTHRYEIVPVEKK